ATGPRQPDSRAASANRPPVSIQTTSAAAHDHGQEAYAASENPGTVGVSRAAVTAAADSGRAKLPCHGMTPAISNPGAGTAAHAVIGRDTINCRIRTDAIGHPQHAHGQPINAPTNEPNMLLTTSINDT